MPQKTKLEINSFVKGLVNAASPLTFPDNASLVDNNFVLRNDGSRKRRLGMDYEDYAVFHESDTPPLGAAVNVSTYTWKRPTKSADYDIIIVQNGDELFFFRSDSLPISGNILNGGSPLNLPGTYNDVPKIYGASLRNQFVITFGSQELGVLSYDEDTDTVSIEYKRLQVRDLFGVVSGIPVDERPTFPSPLTPSDAAGIAHEYNLRNQGWPLSTTVSDTNSGGSSSTADPTVLSNALGFQQKVSDADVFWRARTTAATNPEAINAFSRFELVKQQYGTTPANKGHFVIDLFNRSSDRQTSLLVFTLDPTLVLPNDESEGYLTAVAAYAGRYFYAVKETGRVGGDERSPNLNTFVLFSQIIENTEDINSCYSEADPTSEFVYDVVDSDGGFISIPDAGDIVHMQALGNSLFVFATNGVWEIHGGEQIFSATNQNVTKVTSIGITARFSVVEAESALMYWAKNGIYAITIDPGSLRGVASNLTVNTIDPLYKGIHSSENQHAIGAYEESERKVRWLYRQEGLNDSLRSYTNELVFDIDLRAFYVNTVSEIKATLVDGGMLGFSYSNGLYYLLGAHYQGTTNKLIFSFGSYKNTDFLDFDEDEATATLVTGYLTGGTASTPKQVKSLVVHFARTETGFVEEGDSVVFDNPSGCQITFQWEWTDSATSGRWNRPFQGYRLTVPYYPEDVDDPFDYGYTVITSKTGIRGKGRAISIKFESEPGKDLHILGWGLEVKVDDDF